MTTSVNAPTMTEATVREIASRHQEPDWLLERRLAALRAFDAMTMPDPRAEEWRRTDISGFDFAEALSQTVASTIERSGEPGKAVFIDLHEAAIHTRRSSRSTCTALFCRQSGSSGRCRLQPGRTAHLSTSHAASKSRCRCDSSSNTMALPLTPTS